MVTTISQQNQETFCCPQIENIRIYQRLENIVNKSKRSIKIHKKPNVQKKVHRKLIAHHVNEQKNKAISQALLMFGSIN